MGRQAPPPRQWLRYAFRVRVGAVAFRAAGSWRQLGRRPGLAPWVGGQGSGPRVVLYWTGGALVVSMDATSLIVRAMGGGADVSWRPSRCNLHPVRANQVGRRSP